MVEWVSVVSIVNYSLPSSSLREGKGCYDAIWILTGGKSQRAVAADVTCREDVFTALNEMGLTKLYRLVGEPSEECGQEVRPPPTT